MGSPYFLKMKRITLLSLKQRSVVYSFKFGLSMQEIADKMNLTTSEVEQIIREYMIANSPSVVR